MTAATEANVSTIFSAEQTAEGTALVEEMLAAWANASVDASAAPAAAVDEEDDVVMASVDDGDGLTKEYAALKRWYGEFRPRLEETPWTASVLAQTY